MPSFSRQTYTRLNGGAAALALFWLILIGWTLDPAVDDFERFWQASVDLLRYGNPYITRADYFYPPFFIYLIQPFALVSHEQGQYIWFVLNTFLLGGYIALCIWLSGSVLARRFWGVVLLGVLIAPPTRLSLQLGQVSILVGVLMLGSFALRCRLAHASGLMLALASLIRMHPAFLGLYYLLRKLRSVAWWSLAMASFLILLSLLWRGTAPYISYLMTIVQQNVARQGAYPYGAEHNISLFGLWSRLLIENPHSVPLRHHPSLALALTLLTSIGVVVLCFWVGRSDEGGIRSLAPFGVWLCGMLLLLPTNGYYNLIFLLLPLLVIVRSLEAQPSPRVRLLLVLATALLCIPPGWTSVHPLLYNALHIGWGTLALTPALYGLLICTGLLVWLCSNTSD